MVILAVGAALVIATLLGPITDLIARHDVSALTQTQRIAHLQQARETARTQLLTLGAGIFAAAALLFTALNFTLARQGQVTTRYTDAISQLGSENLDVRIGGIYALERIARDSARDHSTILEVLAAFIREHSHEQWPPLEPGGEKQKRSTRPDIQAALSVIGRRDIRREFHYNMTRIDLIGADLTGVKFYGNLWMALLSDVNFTDADLGTSSFVHATLARAKFIGANLFGSNLQGAILDDAHFNGASIASADLSGARLNDTDFTDAVLTHAHLGKAGGRGANFTGADLRNADLREVQLESANFEGANLLQSKLSKKTILRYARLHRTWLNSKELEQADLSGAFWPKEREEPKGWGRDVHDGTLHRIVDKDNSD